MECDAFTLSRNTYDNVTSKPLCFLLGVITEELLHPLQDCAVAF
jgi:hypothetical protein